MKTIYLTEIIKNVPRILTQVDRRPFSKTFGCADRNYWHYKIVDFPCARFQEATLTLTLIYKIKHKLNPYFNQAKLKEWALACMNFWAGSHARDGSFSEWYPNEHSFVATAFSLYAVSEAYLILEKEIPDSLKPKLKRAIFRAAKWLCQRDELKVSNQQAGAIAALYNSYLITKNEAFKINSKEKLSRLLANQTSEGWFPEYKGFDVGYSSVSLDYLAKYIQRSKDLSIQPQLIKLADFLKYFIQPDFTFGGTYGSRNTEYLLPHGFEIINSSISSAIQKNLELYGLNTDGRYLMYTGYTYLQAFVDAQKTSAHFSPETFEKNFQQAGIFIRSDKNHYLILNYKKGGVIKIFDKKTKKLILEDDGLLVKFADGKLATNQQLSKTRKTIFSKNEIAISGPLFYIKQTPSTTVTHLFLRLFCWNKHLKNFLRDKLITAEKQAPAKLIRTIQLAPKPKIIDEIHTSKRVRQIIQGARFSFLYILPTRYFYKQDLLAKEKNLSPEEINTLNVHKSIKILHA